MLKLKIVQTLLETYWRKLKLATPAIIIALILVSQSSYAQFHQEKLVLWNKLGSRAEIESSELGPDGTFYGGQFVPGMFGDAYVADNTQELIDTFPREVLFKDAGAIEVWAKLVDFPFYFSWGGNSYLSEVPGPDQEKFWHHFALAWNELGVPGVDEGRGEKTVALFVDGQLIASWNYNEGDREFGGLNSSEVDEIQFILSQVSVAVDNVKVWNYAKTDFSDRLIEVPEGYIKGDVNGDGTVGVDDAVLTIQMVIRLVDPDDHQEWAADIDKDDRVRTSDAILILRMIAGLPLSAPGRYPLAVNDRQMTVSLGEVRCQNDQKLLVPLILDGISGSFGGEVCIAYDNTVLRAIGVSSDSGMLLASNLSESSLVRIAFLDASMANDGILAEIQFDMINDKPAQMKLETVEIYGSDGALLNIRYIDRNLISLPTLAEHSALLQNFPNPFNPETWIPYQLIKESYVSISIYDTTGRLVKNLVIGKQPAGVYETQSRAAYWDGLNEAGEPVASGIYFAVLDTGYYQQARRIVLIR